MIKNKKVMTSIEWLESKLPTAFKELTINKELFKQAKEMHKKEIIEAFDECRRLFLIN